MKYELILAWLILFTTCQNPAQEKREVVTERSIVVEHPENDKQSESHKKDNNPEQTNCDKYWKKRFPNDYTRANYINEIASKAELTENNLKFLNALKNEKYEKLAFENVLSPIFRLSRAEIGILAFPKHQYIENRWIRISKEMDLIEKFDTITKNLMEHFGKVKFYPILLDSVFKEIPKPQINYYTNSKIESGKVMQLGYFVDDCLEYYEYSIDTANISINDTVLFSSPFNIDLVFENNKEIDSLIKSDYKKECVDCPNSKELQKTFARVKGTDLYFIYADTFPINNEFDTPSRALILINEKKEIIYLWYAEIDLFGCSCL